MGDIELPAHSVLTTRELGALGFSRNQVTRAVRHGRLHRVERSVYTTAPPEGNLLLRALTRNRPHLIFSGVTAYQLHSRLEVTPPVEAQVGKRYSAQGSPLITLRQLRNPVFQVVRGHRVVSPVAAVRDLIGRCSPDLLVRFLESQYRGRDGQPTLERDLAQLRAPGKLAPLLQAASIGADSETERRLFRALKKRGVEVVQNHLIGHYHWDGVVPDVLVAIEVDGYLYHGVDSNGENSATFVRDRWKANDAARRGFLVLRYTEQCIDHHLDRVVNQIVATVEWRRRDILQERPVEALLDFERRPVWGWHVALGERDIPHAPPPPWFRSPDPVAQ